MDKFRSFKLITDQYLNGKLVDLVVDYKQENEVNVLVCYEAGKFFTLEYELNLDVEKGNVNFVSHGSTRAFQKISLGNEPAFDHAVSQLLFAN